MYIKAIEDDRAQRLQFMDLLLFADPSPKLVNEYLCKGQLFVLYENDTAYGVLHLLPHSDALVEVKNIAVREDQHGRGYGKALLQHALAYSRQQGYRRVIVGTGNSTVGIFAFYQKVGFRFHSVIRDFFVDNYEEPIFENGLQCRDMIVLDYNIDD